MKRMNFTFLLLFALLSFVSSQLGAQNTSSSCINEVNITVDADGGFQVDYAVLGATGPAMSAGSIGYSTGSGTAFPGTGSLQSLFGSCRAGTVQYELWSGPTVGTGSMLCWGDINFEVKTTPDPVYNEWLLMCGQDGPRFDRAPLRLSDISARVNGACSAPITNLSIVEDYDDDKCEGKTYTRLVYGQVNLDGAVRKILLQRDVVVEMPIDVEDIVCPKNDPRNGTGDYVQVGTDSTLHVECGYGTDPEGIEDYYDDLYDDGIVPHPGAAYAYPHLVKLDSTPVTEMLTRIDSIVIDTIQDKIPVGDVWVLADVVTKDTFRTMYDTMYYDVEKIIVPIKKGVQCNLSTKCTDMYFAGCVGEQSKIMRTWQTIDWCEGSTVECMQWIIVHDTDAPRISGRGWDNYYFAPIAPWICSASFAIPSLTWWDDCNNDDITVKYTSSAGTISGGVLSNIWITECPVILYATATDACGNETTVSTYILPVDNVAPVAIAEDQVNVSLTGDPTGAVSSDGGVAKVYVDAIDAGSHDAGCGEVDKCLLLKEELANPVVLGRGQYWSLRGDGRGLASPESNGLVLVGGQHIYVAAQCVSDGTVYIYETFKGQPILVGQYEYVVCKDYVKFCCEDVFVEEEQNYQQVALVVTDNALICDYNELEPRHPNVSHSWTNVRVEDKSGAGWVCVDDYTSCVYTDDFEPKKPYYGGVICNGFYVDEIAREESVECGYGYIVVTWGAYTDDSKEVLVSETQCVYDVYPAAPFNPFEIKWPKHYDGTVYYGVYRECEFVLRTGGDFRNPDHYYPGVVEYDTDVYMGDAQDCVAGVDTGEPVYCNTACGLIGKSYEIDTVSSSDACYKLIKRWTIIDWCTWEPNDNYAYEYDYEWNDYLTYYYPYNYRVYNATDDSNDKLFDEFEAVDDEWLNEGGFVNALTDSRIDGHYVGFSFTDEHGTPGTGAVHVPAPPCASCEKPSGQADDIYFRYTNVNWDGYYTYDQVIKVVDDVDPEIAVEDSEVSITDGNAAKFDYDDLDEDEDPYADCTAKDVIEATATDMCGELDLTAVGASWWIERTTYNADGDAVDYATKADEGETATMSTGYGKPKWYSIITWRVKDGCGNTGYAESRHDFVDNKNPTPVCIQDISTAAMNTDGSVAIWASDYDLGSFDNCSDVEVYFKDEDGNKVPSLGFDCDNLGTNELQMYVSDAWGNEDYCFVTLRIDDNTGICPETNDGAAAISGLVATEIGDNVESAEMALNVGSKTETSVEGLYSFPNTTVNREYQVRAELDNDYLNGVSTLDLVIAQKHILGLEELDSPYKRIAADANGDEKISALDLLAMRKLILGITLDLPNNDSWRFVDASYTFSDPANPFPFKESVDVALGTESALDQNMIAVKIGDLSGNAIANSLIAEGRSVASMNLNITDASVAAGELVEVAITSDKFNDIAAYQYTMELNNLEFVSVASGAVEMSADNVAALDANTLTTAWASVDGISSDDVLFTLTFKATADVTLSEGIAMSSRVTSAEAYSSSADKIDLGLAFNTVEASAFALYQNEPNPFTDATVISFELPQAGEATLSVFDVTGKTVLARTESFAAGKNQINLTKGELAGTGVMYYQLESGDFTATKKMILID